jgi:site-specific DNA recombinase
MNAAIYARVSTNRQEREQTIDSQLAALTAWVRDRGHDLADAHVFADDGYIRPTRATSPGRHRVQHPQP